MGQKKSHGNISIDWETMQTKRKAAVRDTSSAITEEAHYREASRGMGIGGGRDGQG